MKTALRMKLLTGGDGRPKLYAAIDKLPRMETCFHERRYPLYFEL